MKPGIEPLYKRLHLENKWWNYEQKERSITLATALPPKADDFDRASAKWKLPLYRFFFSLACYYAGEVDLAKDHGAKCIGECNGSFFGNWQTYTTEGKTADISRRRRKMNWIAIFDVVLLWGSVLGRWDLLAKVGEFPGPNSYITDGQTRQYRDLYIAIGRFLDGDPRGELRGLLASVEAGRRKFCRLLAKVIGAAHERDSHQMQQALNDFFADYKSVEFPKEAITKKISIHETLLIHWAEKRNSLLLCTEYMLTTSSDSDGFR